MKSEMVILSLSASSALQFISICPMSSVPFTDMFKYTSGGSGLSMMIGPRFGLSPVSVKIESSLENAFNQYVPSSTVNVSQRYVPSFDSFIAIYSQFSRSALAKISMKISSPSGSLAVQLIYTDPCGSSPGSGEVKMITGGSGL